MQCLKCGRRMNDGQVFCSACLEVMEASPVKPDTAVVVPIRPPVRRSSASKAVKPEELVIRLQNKLHRLTVACICLGVLLAAALAGVVVLLLDSGELPMIGQNYSTYAPSDPMDLE